MLKKNHICAFKLNETLSVVLNRYTFTVFSNVLVYCIMWGVLHITGDQDVDAQIGPGDVHKFQKVVLIGIGIGLVASLIFHVFLKEGANGNGDANGNATQLCILTFIYRYV